MPRSSSTYNMDPVHMATFHQQCFEQKMAGRCLWRGLGPIRTWMIELCHIPLLMRLLTGIGFIA